MELKKDDIVNMARLAYLRVKDDEIDMLTEDMKEVIDFAGRLSEYNLDGIGEEEFVECGDFSFALREDVVKESGCTREELLSNAPNQKACCFSVPKVVE